jgi:hypothetical protein
MARFLPDKAKEIKEIGPFRMLAFPGDLITYI